MLIYGYVEHLLIFQFLADYLVIICNFLYEPVICVLVSASTEILLDMISKLSSHKVALVHQMPFTTDQEGLAAAIEKVDCLNVILVCHVRDGDGLS